MMVVTVVLMIMWTQCHCVVYECHCVVYDHDGIESDSDSGGLVLVLMMMTVCGHSVVW